jgi:hypothetical protein
MMEVLLPSGAKAIPKKTPHDFKDLKCIIKANDPVKEEQTNER